MPDRKTLKPRLRSLNRLLRRRKRRPQDFLRFRRSQGRMNPETSPPRGLPRSKLRRRRRSVPPRSLQRRRSPSRCKSRNPSRRKSPNPSRWRRNRRKRKKGLLVEKESGGGLPARIRLPMLMTKRPLKSLQRPPSAPRRAALARTMRKMMRLWPQTIRTMKSLLPRKKVSAPSVSVTKRRLLEPRPMLTEPRKSAADARLPRDRTMRTKRGLSRQPPIPTNTASPYPRPRRPAGSVLLPRTPMNAPNTSRPRPIWTISTPQFPPRQPSPSRRLASSSGPTRSTRSAVLR
mmetsp:Transcript_29452/g.85708  ORF Transcript_29452/g.85708 Transcript_29452/m.85708 type:complete len:289 (+) Transcript_29452:1736-2602(+)